MSNQTVVTKTNKMTNFEMVGEFHETFGHPKETEPQTLIFETNKKLVEFRYNLINEENKETLEASVNNDFPEIADGLCDIQYVTYGSGHALGLDLDKLFSSTYDKENNYNGLSNFQKVVKLNKLSDEFKPKWNIFTTDSELLKSKLDTINLNVQELKKAIDNDNFTDVTECLCKILYVTYDAATAFGLDLDTLFSEVHDCNMTKVCKDEKEAHETVEWYKQNEKKYEDPQYKQKGKYYVVFDNKTSKVLKCIKWRQPDLKKLMTH